MALRLSGLLIQWICLMIGLYGIFLGEMELEFIGLSCLALISSWQYLSWQKQILELKRDKATVRESLIRSQKLAVIGTLASGIAHEINNPLAVIDQEAQWLESLLARFPEKIDEEVRRELKESLSVIQNHVKRCAEVTHRVLQMARRDQPLLQQVELNRLVDDVVRTVERVVGNKKITFVRNFDLSLYPVKTDPPLIRLILVNLLNNAIHAVGDGGEIVIATGQNSRGAVFFSVSDNGPGIPKENLERIFEPLFTTKDEGTGIGLALCQVLAERLGGTIEVESTPGRGTTFTVWLSGGE
ncbi:MAG: two-component sensor histidine kinase [Deltaproteobacteria bacterium]|nr:two-component sensor histidine kinase [Deltaproteobacteria bacterium]MBW2067624.1 two-component sensor histidine kinase [Deltaproteobacteria bacterium]